MRRLAPALALLAAVAAWGLDPPLARYAVTSETGYRKNPLGGGLDSLHRGVDLFGPLGCDVLAAAPGLVTEVWAKHQTFGRMVTIYHEGGIWTLYGHLRSTAVQEGEIVIKGQVIGRQGNTGQSDGEHLHFEVIVDPLILFERPTGQSDRTRRELLR